MKIIGRKEIRLQQLNSKIHLTLKKLISFNKIKTMKMLFHIFKVKLNQLEAQEVKYCNLKNKNMLAIRIKKKKRKAMIYIKNQSRLLFKKT